MNKPQSDPRAKIYIRCVGVPLRILMLHTRQHLCVLLGLLALALLTAPASNSAQTVMTQLAATDLRSANSVLGADDDLMLATRATAALEKLRTDVAFYRSLGEFESNGKLARVSFETFARKLDEVSAEVEPVLSKMHDSKIRSHLSNSLQSYRDGAFWWSKLDQPKVIVITNLRAGFSTTAPAERFFASSVPYTVVINWRLADRYLQRVQKVIAERNAISSRDTPEMSSLRGIGRSIK